MNTAAIEWRWKKFEDLTLEELYAFLALRQEVFTVEQNCAYQDADGLDAAALHLMGYEGGKVVAYLRVFAAGIRYREVAIGRVVTSPQARERGYGKSMMTEALGRIRESFGLVPIRISAQAYLVRFYRGFGFETEGDEYFENGIPHLAMWRA